MKFSKTCECCGQKVTAYTHNLNQPLVEAFASMVAKYLEGREPVDLAGLNLDHKQLCNFQKLRHFGLVDFFEKSRWFPTESGLKFYFGETSVLNPSASMGNKTLEDTHEAWDTHAKHRVRVTIANLLPYHYKQRPQYQAERSDQASIFDRS